MRKSSGVSGSQQTAYYCHIGPVCICLLVSNILSVFVELGKGFSCWGYPGTSWSPLLRLAYGMLCHILCCPIWIAISILIRVFLVASLISSIVDEFLPSGWFIASVAASLASVSAISFAAILARPGVQEISTSAPFRCSEVTVCLISVVMSL